MALYVAAMTASRPPNRLAGERSPYLLQHAQNPVDWRPWGDEAFELARRDDKPVFLSIGYSACHWCHVMERESFEDEATAKLLNAHFVSIKVDREERPDVDQTYQVAHQVLTQRGGGWPLSMFLTPDRKPFFGGTYFPERRRFNMPSFTDVLTALLDAWKNRRDDVVAQSDELTDALARVTTASTGPDVDPSRVLREAVTRVLPRIDRELGGLRGAPKFPNTMTFDLLVAMAASGDETHAKSAREALAITLDGMARGGIRDHLGGGFARYSTDARWHVPHFEKMLYDNAQLAKLYLDGARLLTDDDAITPARCRDVAREVFTYARREMTAPGTAFFSAQDADSEGEEGRFFAWTRDEVTALTGDDAAAVGAWFDVTAEGNWEGGRNVLHTPHGLDAVAEKLGITVDALVAALTRARATLWQARESRPKPLRDDKCLASWNGLMISAFADAEGVLDDDGAWVTTAREHLALWRERAWRDGRLAHAIKDGTPYGEAFLDDHGALACAAIDVFEASFDGEALAFAVALMRAVVSRFVDDTTGEFFFTASDAEVVLHRSRDPYDHAYPSGAGLCLDALARLAVLTGDAVFRAVSERATSAYASRAASNPMGLATLIRGIERVARGSVEVILMGDPDRDDTRAMRSVARKALIPRRALFEARDASHATSLGLDGALFDGRSAGPEGAPVAYVCRGDACEMPARNPEALAAAIRRASR